MTSVGGLKIGLVCPYAFDTPGGVQNHVLGLSRHLRASGHDPHILAPGHFRPEGTRYVTAGPAPALAGDDELARFTSAGAPVPVRYNGSVARVNFGPLSAARVRHWLRAGDFDLVHIHEPITPSISMLALWAADVPVVATFHTATPRSRSMQLAGAAFASAVAKIDAGIAVSESARDVVVQHLGRDATVIPNGFRYDDFAVGRISGRRSGRRLSFLGRMDEPRKGLDTLLAALPRIRDSFGDLEVVVAGQGQRRLPDGCRSLGLVSDRQKAELLATSDVFVAPHLARESFGIVLLEAMASQTAVVASDLAAFTDLLSPRASGVHRSLGLTFPAGDPAALATAVQHTLAHPDSGRVEAAARASRRYDWSVVGDAVAEVYRAVAGMPSAGTVPGVRRVTV